MNIVVKKVENIIIDNDTEQFLRSLGSALAEFSREFEDEIYEVDNLREAIEEFLDYKRLRVE